MVVPDLASAGAKGWTDQSLQVVGGPIDVDGMIVLLNVNKSHDLEMSGIRPTDGAVLWSHPYGLSQITPGVAFAPVAIGDTVLLGTLHGRIVTAVRPDLDERAMQAFGRFAFGHTQVRQSPDA